MTNKAEMRRETRSKLARLYEGSERGVALRDAHSREICASIRRHPAWRAARTICAFLPLRGEPQIAPLWEDGCASAFCFPRLRDGEIQIVRVSEREILRRADWKMRLPELDAAPLISAEEVDLHFVPGLAFTMGGARLGRGGGHYDRLLARKSPGAVAMAVCFSEQIVDEVPWEPHDVGVDAIATERGVIEVIPPSGFR